MPMYEYECRKCERVFEALVYADDTPECPECHGTKLEKLLSVPARPQTADLPMACPTDAPPCGPGCCRL